MRKLLLLLLVFPVLLQAQVLGIYYSPPKIANDMAGKKAYFHGDSIMEGYNSSPSTNRWTTLFCAAFGATEINFAVSGKNMQGATTCNAAGTFSKTEIVSYNAATDGGSLIGLSTNDILQNNGVSTVADYKIKYLDVLDYAINTRGWPPWKITIFTPYFVFNLAAYVGTCGSSAADQARVDAYVQATKEVAAAMGVNLVDTYQFTSTSAAYKTSIAGDNLHPNNAGYALLASYIENQFQ